MLTISKSLPSCSPQSQYTHAPLPATHHCAAVPPPIDSRHTVSTTVPHIQGWQVPFESHAPPHPPPPQELHPDVPTSYGDSVYDYSTAPYSPSTSNQGSMDGIQTNRCHFGFSSPPLRPRNNIKEIVQNALTVIGVVCLFCHPIWNAQDVGRCTSCAFPNIS